jgi:hypothetical protein
MVRPGPRPAPQALAGGTGRLDGVWRTDGYGTVLAVDGRGVQEYQTTAVSCLKGDEEFRKNRDSAFDRAVALFRQRT